MSNQTPEEYTDERLRLMAERGFGSAELRAALAAERSVAATREQALQERVTFLEERRKRQAEDAAGEKAKVEEIARLRAEVLIAAAREEELREGFMHGFEAGHESGIMLGRYDEDGPDEIEAFTAYLASRSKEGVKP